MAKICNLLTTTWLILPVFGQSALHMCQAVAYFAFNLVRLTICIWEVKMGNVLLSSLLELEVPEGQDWDLGCFSS